MEVRLGGFISDDSAADPGLTPPSWDHSVHTLPDARGCLCLKVVQRLQGLTDSVDQKLAISEPS